MARALPLQGRCRGFESLCAHHRKARSEGIFLGLAFVVSGLGIVLVHN